MNTRRPFRQQRFLFIIVLSYFCPLLLPAQEDSAKEEKKSLIYLRYYVINNEVPYVNIQTKNKIGKKFLPEAKVQVKVYLDNDVDDNSLVGTVVTNENGTAIITLPVTLASIWKEKSSHTFFAHTDSTASFLATSEELAVNKSKLEIDTVNEGETRSLKVRLLKSKNNALVPAAEVEMRLAVKRLGGYLNIGEKQSYTTDSTGVIQAEFSRKDLPGDSLGNLELVALVDDNDEVGTLETRMKVPWGLPTKFETNFNDRSLYATGNRAPGWLLIMALGCIISVWSIIIYLIIKIFQIKKLGTKEV